MNKQSFIILISSIISICLWFFLIYTPYTLEKKTLAERIKTNNSQIIDFEQTINLIPKYLVERKRLKQKKDFINSKLYTKEEVLNLFHQLKIDAHAKNLEVTEITPPIEELLHLNRSIPDSTKPQFLNIGVSVSGSYIEFAKFIKKIENEPYFRGINACRISGSKDFNQELKLYIGFKALLGRIGGNS